MTKLSRNSSHINILNKKKDQYEQVLKINGYRSSFISKVDDEQTLVGFKWPEKSWNAVKQNNHLTKKTLVKGKEEK